MPATNQPSAYTVYGTVYDEFDMPGPVVVVKIYEVDFRSRKQVAETKTDAAGQYKVSFDALLAADPEYKAPDIQVEILDPNNQLVGRTAIYFNVAESIEINYKKGGTGIRGLDEFNTLLQKIQQVIGGQQVQPGQLVENEQFQDISFLAGETGKDYDYITYINTAFAYTSKTRIPADIFYALFRQGYPLDLNQLLLSSSVSITAAIQKAIDSNIISSKWLKQTDAIIKLFNNLALSHLLDANNTDSAEFKKITGLALSADQQKTFAGFFYQQEPDPGKFWDQLATQTGFGDGKTIASLKALLQINLLTKNAALTTSVFTEFAANPDGFDLKKLAATTAADWKARIGGLVASGQLTSFPDGIGGGNTDEKITDYASAIDGVIQQLYPSAVFSKKLAADNSNPFGDRKPDLNRFFDNNSGIDLSTTRIDSVFAASSLNGITDKEKLHKELKKINRLYKLTPDYSQVVALSSAGIDSAVNIVKNYSADSFAGKFGNALGTENAKAIYNKALRLDHRVTALALGLKAKNSVPVYVIDGGMSTASPDYVSLFGENNCDCEYCQSVYSPSAYLTDILHFLETDCNAAFTGLNKRRPDLVQILLTCGNTNTVLPYIDLVNELLENAISAPLDGSGNPVWPQTTNTTEELIAFPEHTNTAAYAKLATATSSFGLPLNIPLEEERLYLQKLGTSRNQLRELSLGKNISSKYNDPAIAADYLNISGAELSIFKGITVLPVALDTVSEFLSQTGLSYIEMLQLLECYFINPFKADGKRTITIVAKPGKDAATCNIDDLGFSEAGAGSKTINPFIRLWKKTGWNIFDLDRFLTAAGITSFTATADRDIIVPLANIGLLRYRYNLTVTDILSCWSLINTRLYTDHVPERQPVIPARYQEFFQNKKISNPVDPAFSDPAALSGNLEDKSQIIMGAFNLNQVDFALLSAAPVTDGQLNLINLSIIYRHTLLAKILRVPVNNLLAFINTSKLNPFTGFADSAALMTFIDNFSIIKSSGYSITDVELLLGHAPVLPVIRNNASIASALSSLRDGLQKQDQPALRQQFIADTLAASFKTDSDIAAQVLALTGQSALFTDNAFISSSSELFETAANGTVTWTFPAITDGYNLLQDTHDRINKLSAKLKITAEELAWLLTNAEALGLADLFRLPAATDQYPQFEKLISFVALRNKLTIRQPAWYNLFDTVLDSAIATKMNFIDLFVQLSGLERSDIETLLGPSAEPANKGVFQFDFPADYLSGRNLLTVIGAAENAKLLGSTIRAAAALITDDTDLAATAVAAGIAKGLLKAKCDDVTWLSVLTPLSNSIRTKKRDSLASFIITDPSLAPFRNDNAITGIDSIYSNFLIDPEMDACMLTSRIKQALSSVQLYIDRALMNLETGVVPSADFAKQWNSWRKQFRVWEANRKIFLYPENWMEPELRDDKSPFFKDLESALRQNDINDDSVHDAVYNYLQKLDAVSNLEIAGIFTDTVSSRVHVIGRSKTVPHLYYYTKQYSSRWTAWEKVEVDIEGDHLLPVVWNNRLFIFWAVCKLKEVRHDGGTDVPVQGGIIPPAAKYLEVKLAWSEYKNGNWSSKKQSSELFSDESILRGTLSPEPGQISLGSAITAGTLQIRINMPIRSDIVTEFVMTIGTFTFDGCNNAPHAAINEASLDLATWLARVKNTTENFNEMNENGQNDRFSLYDSGPYKLVFDFDNKERVLFNNTPGLFRMVTDRHMPEKKHKTTLFYNNKKSNFYIWSVDRIRPDIFDDVSVLSTNLIARKTVDPRPTLNNRLAVLDTHIEAVPVPVTAKPVFSSIFFGQRYTVESFYHPYACNFISRFNQYGFDGLYAEDLQNAEPVNIFSAVDYNPTGYVRTPYPVEKVDFDINSLYSIYNWELFFHVPMLVAARLSQNQKFDEARKWFHYIFNPTRSGVAGAGAERFWLTAPFKNEIRNTIISIEQLFNDPANQGKLDTQLAAWEQNPFNPFAIARFRYTAFMKSTLMKYIDNLISWADQLFRRDTIESINEATLLYILAANTLGKKPERVPERAGSAAYSYSTIAQKLDQFSNAKVAIESFISLSEAPPEEGNDENMLMPMFCIPKNDVLLKYWDVIADRLFKIRHCQNIDGVFRQLPLFEPPIDPALLVKGAAAGLDLNSILNDINAALPVYRFQVILQKANELCNDVKMLGSELLAALEKKDAEQLSRLRVTHELNMLGVVRESRMLQRDEAKQNLDALNNTRDTIQARLDYYSSRENINVNEAVFLASIQAAAIFQNMAITSQTLAAIGYALPNVTIGPFSSGATEGGGNMGHALQSAGAQFSQVANFINMMGTTANVMGGYQRRQEDWNFQAQAAGLELKQVAKQIAAAEIRVAIAEKELENHDLQIAQNREVDDYLNSKFTGEELYDYMSGQVSATFFQSYQLAYTIAKKAEHCFRHELGMPDSDFIRFGYWDSLKKGLLSGEKLQLDLRRLENAYLEQNRRELELTKHISLLQLDPLQLLTLKETGSCLLNIPEEIFDLDFPGHYFRRIKSVSLSLPCITGPYTTINATLRLVKNKFRAIVNDDDYAETAEEKATWGTGRYVSIAGQSSAIALSSGQTDSGLFELSFRDERYLPFEGFGTISQWSLELNDRFRQFDYGTIADVILHMHYTAREENALANFRSKVNDYLDQYFSNQLNNAEQPFTKLITIRQDFSVAFYQLQQDNPVNTTINISKKHFGRLFINREIQVTTLQVSLLFTSPVTAADAPAGFKINDQLQANWQVQYNGYVLTATIDPVGFDIFQPLTLEADDASGTGLKNEKLADILLFLKYNS